MKNILSYIFIVYIIFITRDCLCMSMVLIKPAFRPSKHLLHTQHRNFCSRLTLSEERCAALCRDNKNNQEKLLRLKQDSYANLREIWRLEDTIKYNNRTLFMLKKRISEEAIE
jgi:hypothetical protein